MARITFEGRRYPLQPEEPALDALLRGGADVPFSCRKASCHTCLLQAVDGAPGAESQRGLTPEMRKEGYFLPCACVPKGDLTVKRPDRSALFTRALVSDHQALTDSITRITLEVVPTMRWRAGQYVNVRHPSGTTRSYSIASVQADDVFLTLYVRRVSDGLMSRWLCDAVRAGDEVEIQGPVGACHYLDDIADVPLLMLATGTGFAALLGVAREALAGGHRAPIALYHGVRDASDLILRDEAMRLAASHPNLTYQPCVSRATASLPADVALGRVTEVAFKQHETLRGWMLYACGLPAMVSDARVRAVGAGIERGDIHADPFVTSAPYIPDDNRKLAAIKPDLELWQALREGDGLTQILTEFYGHVFEDPRLAPFFHRISKQRAIEKQYEFLRGVFTGNPGYMGLNPFNAHHWMVISDELFDYREQLFDACLVRYGLPDHLRWRWAAIHETFRPEIVKTHARGLFVHGVEHSMEGYVREEVTVATVCDGCSAEMHVGTSGRMHVRTGEFFCPSCDAKRVGATGRPPIVTSRPPPVLGAP